MDTSNQVRLHHALFGFIQMPVDVLGRYRASLVGGVGSARAYVAGKRWGWHDLVQVRVEVDGNSMTARVHNPQALPEGVAWIRVTRRVERSRLFSWIAVGDEVNIQIITNEHCPDTSFDVLALIKLETIVE